MTRPRIGLYWCAGCGGCEKSVVDLAERLLEVVALADIAFWPVALDFKLEDVLALEEGALAAVLINGAVRTSEQARMARLLRRKARTVVAHGTCAWLGGVVGLGDFCGGRALLEQAYRDAPSLVGGEAPRASSTVEGFSVELPEFFERVLPLGAVVEVDCVIPGCPPSPDLVYEALKALLVGPAPPRGTVLGGPRALCDTCTRRDSKPETLGLTEMRRVHRVEVDPQRCFLAQGITCIGPATRGGWQDRCLRGNMPCTGCFGPTDRVLDQGARFASMLASSIDARDAEQIEVFVDSIPDPAGLFYRYSLAAARIGPEGGGAP